MPVRWKPFKKKIKESGMVYKDHYNSVTEDPAFSVLWEPYSLF